MIIFYALIGLAAGGVVNQLADVFPIRHAKVTGAVCAACGQPRSAIQFLAVVAYLTGQRACRSCGHPIALRNVLVEVAAAGMFVALAMQPAFAKPLKLALGWFHASVLLLVTVTDFEHRLIPERATLPAIALAALTCWLWFWHEYWYVAFIGGLIGYVFFWLTVVVGNKAIGRGAMSRGDITLAAYVGLITGFPGIITALVVTILAGGIISFVLLLVRVVNLRSGIPYGPFIALGGFVTMVWGQQIMTRFFFGS
ncbi:MAG: prepilin peptidase [Chloroflexi bacterium]|nr:prepilin peptidase [Chloroflexota bacterium]